MSDKQALHENFTARDDVKAGSERSLGLIFAVVFIIVALLPLLTISDQPGSLRLWALFIAAFFAITAPTMPRLLALPNKLWFRFGLLLHKIVNPLIMGMLFFLTVTPIGLIMRSLCKTPLKLRFDKSAESYWIPRAPPGPGPLSLFPFRMWGHYNSEGYRLVAEHITTHLKADGFNVPSNNTQSSQN